MAWTAAINLTAIREPVEIARRHVLESLTALEVLRERGVHRFVDIGSGGGYPALPLAVALPADAAVLVESVGKKSAFLAAAVRAMGLDGHVAVATARAEALASDPAHREAWPAATVRAVGGLGDLVELAFPLLRPGGVLVAWKGGGLADELAAGRRAAAALGGGTVEMRGPFGIPGLEGHRLACVTKKGTTPDSYPRDPAERKRRPW